MPILTLTTALPILDNFDLDQLKTDWPYNQTNEAPRGYSDADQANLVIETAPAVNAPGTLQILYVALSQLFDGTGTQFTVPDECIPAIKWGVIADMLGKVGRGHDPARAQWAEQQYQEGVEAAKVILKGWQ